ncbi:MAG TPA: DUF1801 domain-containing protein [Candidatus Kapabacteria bacterium]|nr:DUF1801 domain-containing protein [Candidatus Kapabacteria bacterium]
MASKKGAGTAKEQPASGAPRTASGSARGSFGELAALMNPAIQPIAWRLREIIFEVLPNAEESVWASGWKVAMYRDGGDICGIGPGRDYVNFYLRQGAHLPDPDGLLEGTGKGMRHVKVRSLDAIPVKGIRRLIREGKKLAK